MGRSNGHFIHADLERGSVFFFFFLYKEDALGLYEVEF